jgi:hypothetical protein
MAMIGEKFPSTVEMDWSRAFQNDIELFGRVLRDILKVDQTVPGRSGPRPVLNKAEATGRLRQFMGVDYSELPFQESFRALAHGKSIRNIAAFTGLDRNLVHKLLNGKAPDLYTMEVVATSFKKDPSYFLEYRVAYILGALQGRLEASPEMSVDIYRKFQKEGR